MSSTMPLRRSSRQAGRAPPAGAVVKKEEDHDADVDGGPQLHSVAVARVKEEEDVENENDAGPAPAGSRPIMSLEEFLLSDESHLYIQQAHATLGVKEEEKEEEEEDEDVEIVKVVKVKGKGKKKQEPAKAEVKREEVKQVDFKREEEEEEEEQAELVDDEIDPVALHANCRPHVNTYDLCTRFPDSYHHHHHLDDADAGAGDPVHVHVDAHSRFTYVACPFRPGEPHRDSLVVAVKGAHPHSRPGFRATGSGCGVFFGPQNKKNKSCKIGFRTLTGPRAELKATLTCLEAARKFCESGGSCGCARHPQLGRGERAAPAGGRNPRGRRDGQSQPQQQQQQQHQQQQPQHLVRHLVIKTESDYVVNGLAGSKEGRRPLVTNWEHNGYRTADGNPVKNADVWRELVLAVEGLKHMGVTVQFWEVAPRDNVEAQRLAEAKKTWSQRRKKGEYDDFGYADCMDYGFW